jgi:transcriptional regulator with XRE-family HTH domain
MSESDRAAALRALLNAARARLSPEAAGLSRTGRRRVPGLRRSEVAELVGVSEAWYVRFENGKARLSLGAVSRIADILRLDAADRSRLFRLARPELDTVASATFEDELTGLASFRSKVRAFGKACRAASTSDEVARAATDCVYELTGKAGLAYWRTRDFAAHAIEYRSLTGYNAHLLVGYAQSIDTITHVLPLLERGDFVAEPDLALSPSAEIRARIATADIRSYAATPLQDNDTFFHVLGIAWREPREITSLERFVLEAVGTTAEVALFGNGVAAAKRA